MNYETIWGCQVRFCIMGFRLTSSYQPDCRKKKMCVEEINNSNPVLLSNLNKNDVKIHALLFFSLGPNV